MKIKNTFKLIEPDKLSLVNFYTGAVEPDQQKSTTTIFANGVMQARCYLEYEYDCKKIEGSATLAQTIHHAVRTHLLDHGNLQVLSGKGEANSVRNQGWEIASAPTNPNFIHDLEHSSQTPSNPVWDEKKNTVSGALAIYLIPPAHLKSSYEVGVQYVGDAEEKMRATVTVNTETFSISAASLTMEVIRKVKENGKANNFYKLYSLRYADNAVPGGTKLVGLTHDGKYGITVANLQDPNPCNILITFAQRDDAKVAGFYDPTFNADTTQILVAYNDQQLYATRYNWGGITYAEQYYFKGSGWDDFAGFSPADISTAHTLGIPFVTALEKDQYKLKHNNEDGDKVDMDNKDVTDKFLSVYDNCGNRLKFRLSYKEHDWDKDDKEPILILEAVGEGAYAGIPAPAWTRADFQ